MFFTCSLSSKVYGGSSLKLLGLKFVELHWFVVCWSFWRLWAWFQQTLSSRQVVWMVLLRMFFDFEVEVLEGFEAWFLQSFCTFECFWIFFDAASALDVLVCRNALGRLLFIGVCGWVSDTWWSLISDMWHSLIRGALRLFLQDTWHLLIGRYVLIFKVTHVSTRLDCLCHYLHAPMCDWFSHAFYAFISKSDSRT